MQFFVSGSYHDTLAARPTGARVPQVYQTA